MRVASSRSARGDDGVALVAANGQQMLAIPSDDHVIGIVGHGARHAGRRHQPDERGVMRHQRRDAGPEALQPAGELRIAQRLRQFVEQHRAAEEFDLPGNGRFQEPPRRTVPQQPGYDDVRIEHQPQRLGA